MTDRILESCMKVVEEQGRAIEALLAVVASQADAIELLRNHLHVELEEREKDGD